MHLNKILRLNRHTAFANKVFSFMIDNKIDHSYIYQFSSIDSLDSLK